MGYRIPLEETRTLVTLDATPVPVFTYAIPADAVTHIRFRAAARGSDGSRVLLSTEGGIERTGEGTPRVISGAILKTIFAEGAARNCTLDLVGVDTVVEFRAIGDSIVQIDWGFNADIETVLFPV
jgi:hypothetical protein